MTYYEQEEGPCQCCGRPVDDCICPECEQCGGVGDPKCYEEHGLVLSEQQLQGQRDTARAIEKARAEEMELLDELEREMRDAQGSSS